MLASKYGFLFAGGARPLPNLGDYGPRNSDDCGDKDCGDTVKCMPTKVEEAMDHGFFTISAPLHPEIQWRDRCRLSKLTEADLPAPLWKIAVPEEHKLLDLLVRVEPRQPVMNMSDPCNKESIGTGSGCQRPTCCKTDNAGIMFDVVMQEYDNNCGELIGDIEVAATVDGEPLTGLTAMDYKLHKSLDLNRFVDSCRTLLIGIRLTALPDEGDIECAPFRITPVAKVHGYDQSLHMG